MGLPDTLPCTCLNSKCGHQFYTHYHRPFGGKGGRNIISRGNMTYCPKCGGKAAIADWTTDSQGNFQLHGFINLIRKIDSIEKLDAIKAGLEATNDEITGTELTETLAGLDPNFSKLGDTLKAIPPSSLSEFITTFISIIALVTAIKACQHSGEQLELTKEQFEYQKQSDIINSNSNDAVEKLERKISELESDFEKKLKNKNIQKTMPPSRNSPCSCGSGQRYKYCCGRLI